eukprot:CAMPEP_0171105752 /NCGR_PEP_ID=MMETSP0766_2-20121228/63374_1 /TAXON_ID=439317 /ORGANISM="Gambierdiscus australes, Strain CAWD 149" /LENGTH=120 /DNA_ID=CAMNT_0011566685 /DNA_START=42 /DNA_END=404 /DNA_ORIENTATION=+
MTLRRDCCCQRSSALPVVATSLLALFSLAAHSVPAAASAWAVPIVGGKRAVRPVAAPAGRALDQHVACFTAWLLGSLPAHAVGDPLPGGFFVLLFLGTIAFSVVAVNAAAWTPDRVRRRK